MSELFQRLANRFRRKMGKPALPRRCCRDASNRSALVAIEGRPDFGYTVCLVCKRRHFEVTVDAGKLGLKGT